MMANRVIMRIRYEAPEDTAGVRHVNEQAFGQKNEADLVDSLRRSNALELSLVAVEHDQIVGHIAFSPVTVETETSSFQALGLGPMAVLPSYQKRGIGSQLVKKGLNECEKAGHAIVFVLGHPEFYSRLGFCPSKLYGLRWKHDVPDDVFMVKEIRKGALAGRTGTVKYRPEFSTV
jgi:putative acetyltransferase